MPSNQIASSQALTSPRNRGKSIRRGRAGIRERHQEVRLIRPHHAQRRTSLPDKLHARWRPRAPTGTTTFTPALAHCRWSSLTR
jgi:hypothetical protein